MKAIQYREDGKFYGFDNPTLPQYINSPNIRNYEDELRSNLAAGKEIINPEVLKGQLEWIKGVHGNEVSPLKVGDIFDCPDNIEFEDQHQFYCMGWCDCLAEEYNAWQGKGDTQKVIRLKLKEVKQLFIDLWKEGEQFYNATYSGTEMSEFLKPYVINSYIAGIKSRTAIPTQ